MINRRNFLKGLGCAAATIPVMSHLGPAARADGELGPRRIIVLSYAQGIARRHWNPIGTGTSFTLPYLTQPLEEFRDRCLFVSNVDNKVVEVPDGASWGHQLKQESALTGTLTTDIFAGGRNHVDDVRNLGSYEGSQAKGPSICSVVGDAVRSGQPRRSVNFGLAGTGHYEDTFDSRFAWAAEASAETLVLNPALAFDDLFAGIGDGMTGPDPAELAERTRRRSVLDAVRESFAHVRSGLDYRDRRRLDLHSDYIRQIEVDLGSRALCAQPTGIARDRSWFDTAPMTEWADMHVRMLAQAMACDMAPVGRLEFFHQQDPYFGIPTVDDELERWRASLDRGWHGMIHGEDDPAGQAARPDQDNDRTGYYNPALLDGLRFYVQTFANLLRELDRFEEGPDGRTVLDNSLCVLATDMGDGYGHGGKKMGYVLAGNLGPFATGYHFDGTPDHDEWYRESSYDHTAVLSTIANAFCLRDASGAELSSFGLGGFASGALPIPRI